jgi:alpha/beta superfamily hydrolase
MGSRSLSKKPLIILFIILFGSSILISSLGVYVLDGTRNGHSYTVPISDDPSSQLAYTVWDPLIANRSDRVVFLYHGFCASQSWMYPMMRELTRLGYHVITVDVRGHGASGGLYVEDPNILLQDFDTVFNDVKEKYPSWNWTAVAIAGHSMGGYIASYVGMERSVILTSVGIAPASITHAVNSTNPKNYLVLIGGQDQLLGPSILVPQYQTAFPGEEIGTLYYNSSTGCYHEAEIIDNAHHEDELMTDAVISEAISFIDMTFGYLTPNEKIPVNQTARIDFIFFGLFIGLGVMAVFFILVNRKINPESQSIKTEPLENSEAPVINTTIKEQSISTKKVLIYWIPISLVSLLPAAVIMGISLFVMPSGFLSVQLFFIPWAGFTALLFYWILAKKVDPDAPKLKIWLKQSWKQTIHSIKWQEIGWNLIGVAITLFVCNYGMAQSYLTLFPLNLRALYLLFMIPVFFFAFLVQGWFFLDYLIPRLQSFWKSLVIIMLIKYGVLYAIGLIAFAMGSAYITLILLLTGLDIATTLVMIIAYYYTKNLLPLVIWATLFLSIAVCGIGVYMHYAMMTSL